MKKTLAAAVLISISLEARAQIAGIPTLNFDGRSAAGSPLPSGPFHFKLSDHSQEDSTPETRMIKSAKAAVVDILIAVKWADVADADLPLDSSKIPEEAKPFLQQMSPEELKAFVKKMKIPKISRDKLPEYSTLASGTGYIVKTTDGKVVCLTNAHVANAAGEATKGKNMKTELHIKLSNDPFANQANADDILATVGATGKHGMDIAILNIPQQTKDGKAWPTLELGDSSTVDEGEQVWAMGFPMGLNYTTTHGIASAVHVTLDNPYVSYIQTDAAINPGNSGGPLVRMESGKPEVIAMDTQILSESGGSQGLGFAIESNTIKRALAQYLRTGAIDAGYVGMVFGRGKGAAQNTINVESVTKDGPAAKAGLQAGDVVKRVAGKDVPGNAQAAMFEISQAIKAKDPGQTVELTVSRKGQDVEIKITVEKEPAALPGADDDKEETDGGK